MADKQQFLQGVRAAISRGSRPVPEAPSRPPHRPRPADILAKAEQAQRQAALQRGESLGALARVAPLQGWNFVRVTTAEEAAEAVATIASQAGAKVAVRSAHALFTKMPLDSTLTALGLQLHPLTPQGTPRNASNALRDLATHADLGITGVEYVVAETATAVLLFQEGNPRLPSLLPPVHVVVAEAAQVVPTLEEALALCHGEIVARGWTSHAIAFISGPSRTADIEQTIVVGIHGPREVHLVLIDD